MPRRRSHRQDDADAPMETTAWRDSLPPKVTQSGKANPAYYREMLNRLNEMMMQALENGEGLPDGFAQGQKGILEAAKLAGLSEKDILDERSEERIAADAISQILDNGSILEVMDEQITAMEKLLDKADIETMNGLNKMRATPGAYVSQMDYDVHMRRSQKGKVLRSLLARAKRLRARCRPVPCPKRAPNSWTDREIVQCGGQILRLMVYASQPDTGTDWKLNWHHGIFALALWMVVNRVQLADFGMVPGPKYTSCACIIPPGHGKTTIGVHFVLSRIAENPRSMGIIVHAQGKMAEQNLAKVASYFKGESTSSKRYLSLFPYLQLADSDNNQANLRVKTDYPTKSPTVAARGFNAKYNGSDADWIWFDDPVDQTDALNPSVCENALAKMNGTWLRRIRASHNSIDFTTATLWSKDDPVSRRISPPIYRPEEMLLVQIPAGGPSKNFKPVWPEVYGEAKLRSIYRSMNDPHRYSCVYECNPTTDSSRLIKSVRLYDPKLPEHTKFMASATRHLSLDPAASKGKNSDPAGIVYCADGDVVTEGSDSNTTERRLRVIKGDQLPSTQTELTEYAVNFCKTNDVDYIHVETRSAFAASAEMIEKIYGEITIRHDPKNKSKVERVRAVAPLIEDGNATSGVRAVVEFPGVYNETGQLVIDPSIAWLADQFLNFGITNDDHGLDALVQVALYLAPTLSAGGNGYASSIIRQMSLGENDTGRRFIEYIRARNKPADPQSDTEEASWLSQNWL